MGGKEGGIAAFLSAFLLGKLRGICLSLAQHKRDRNTHAHFLKKASRCALFFKKKKKRLEVRGKGKKKKKKKGRGNKTSGQQQRNGNKSECCSLALPARWCCRGIRTGRRT